MWKHHQMDIEQTCHKIGEIIYVTKHKYKYKYKYRHLTVSVSFRFA